MISGGGYLIKFETGKEASEQAQGSELLVGLSESRDGQEDVSVGRFCSNDERRTG